MNHENLLSRNAWNYPEREKMAEIDSKKTPLLLGYTAGTIRG